MSSREKQTLRARRWDSPEEILGIFLRMMNVVDDGGHLKEKQIGTLRKYGLEVSPDGIPDFSDDSLCQALGVTLPMLRQLVYRSNHYDPPKKNRGENDRL